MKGSEQSSIRIVYIHHCNEFSLVMVAFPLCQQLPFNRPAASKQRRPSPSSAIRPLSLSLAESSIDRMKSSSTRAHIIRQAAVTLVPQSLIFRIISFSISRSTSSLYIIFQFLVQVKRFSSFRILCCCIYHLRNTCRSRRRRLRRRSIGSIPGSSGVDKISWQSLYSRN